MGRFGVGRYAWALFGDTLMNWNMDCIVWAGLMNRLSGLFQGG